MSVLFDRLDPGEMTGMYVRARFDSDTVIEGRIEGATDGV